MDTMLPEKKVRGVVFDLDHTLFDRYATLDEISRELCRDLGEYLNEDYTQKDISALIIEADSKYILYGWEKVYEYLVEKGMFRLYDNGNALISYEKYIDYMWDVQFPFHAVPFSFTVPMLKELKDMGIKIGLLTNAIGERGHRRQLGKLRVLGIEKYFDEIIITSDIGIHKPDRRIFDIMTERMGIPAENMLYVGDNPINDVKGSKEAGYIPVWVSLRQSSGESADDCEYSVKDVSEIPALVRKLNK